MGELDFLDVQSMSYDHKGYSYQAETWMKLISALSVEVIIILHFEWSW